MFSTVVVFTLLLFNYGLCSEETDDKCKADTDCDMELAICVKSKCICPPGFIENSDMTKCLQGSNGFDSECEDSLQCSYSLKSGGYCSSSNTCKCNEKYHYLRGRCWKSSGLGEKCHNDENCYVSHDFESAVCDPMRRVCLCAPGYYQREYSSCRRISGPGGPCGIALDCMNCTDAVCSRERKCVCNGKKLSRTKFSPTRSTYQYLTKGCPGVQEAWYCAKGQKKPYSEVGDNCTKQEDCSSIENSYCADSKRCLCKSGFYANKSKTSCHPELGSPCTADSDCVGKNMMCRDSKKWCACRAGFVAAENNQMCEKMSRNISWSCLTNEECSFFGPRGICVKKKCHCTQDSHFVVDKLYCWATKRVGEACKQGLDCGQNDTIESCSEGRCKCKMGYHRADSGLSCRQDSIRVGQPCANDDDCVFQNSYCSKSGTCLCQDHFITKDGTCHPGIGSKCGKTEDCSEVKESSCDNGICVCGADMVTSRDWSTCLPLVTKYSGLCQEVDQCTKLLGVGAACNNNACVCSKGYHYVNGRTCYLERALNAKCSYNSECITPNAYCLKGTCSCKYNYKAGPKNDTCSGGNMTTYTGLVLILLAALSVQT